MCYGPPPMTSALRPINPLRRSHGTMHSHCCGAVRAAARSVWSHDGASNPALGQFGQMWHAGYKRRVCCIDYLARCRRREVFAKLSSWRCATGMGRRSLGIAFGVSHCDPTTEGI
jgi:hypothetical protein